MGDPLLRDVSWKSALAVQIGAIGLGVPHRLAASLPSQVWVGSVSLVLNPLSQPSL